MRRHRLVHGNPGDSLRRLPQTGAHAHGPYLAVHVPHLRSRLPAASPVYPFLGISLDRAGPSVHELYFRRGIFKRALPKKRERCPWAYDRSGWNVGGVIRLDYAPAWFLVGLLFERVILGEPVEKDGGKMKKKS